MLVHCLQTLHYYNVKFYSSFKKVQHFITFQRVCTFLGSYYIIQFYRTPLLHDISINDFKNINLTPCKAGQDPFSDKCFPRAKYDEFINMMMTQASKGLSTMGMQELIDQSINSMAIPGRSLEDMCEDCN